MRFDLNEIFIRTVTEEDVDEVARTWEMEKGKISTEKALKAIAWMNANHDENELKKIKHLCLAIFKNDKIIGWCGLDGRFNDVEKIFYLIDEKHRKKGYATLCAKKLLEYGFETMQLDRIVGECAKDNIPSIKILKNIGMRECDKRFNPDSLCYYIDRNDYFDILGKLKKFYSLCLQGSVKDALDYLLSIPNKNNVIVNLIARYDKRFVKRTEEQEFETNDPWIRNVLSQYTAYFRLVLMNENKDRAEQELIKSLNSSIDKPRNNLSDIEDELKKVFELKGYNFLGGKTLPFFGPYIWKTTKKETFSVQLLDELQEVHVFFLSDFLMVSWTHYATFGKYYSGGWSKPEGLYYVNLTDVAVDTDSNDFQVWFLKHEAQHLYDYKHFPGLKQKDLEYRAKLMELIYSSHPKTLVEEFIVNAKNDQDLPHPYANYTIITNLSQIIFRKAFVSSLNAWETIDDEIISKNAKELFRFHTEELIKRDKNIKGII